MTLLKLLRQELPKRGGWPEGADYAVQDGDGSNDIKFGAGEPSVQYEYGEVWHNTKRSDWGICTSESYIRDIATLADDHATAIVTREQYEATGYDGTGLPPVGMKVEWLSDEYGWLGGTVAAHDAKYPLIAIIRHNDGYTGCHRHELRTEAERAIDEMVRLSGVSIGAAKILYDAGYRK